MKTPYYLGGIVIGYGLNKKISLVQKRFRGVSRKMIE